MKKNRDYRVTIRYTEEEGLVLEEEAKAAGITLAALVRQKTTVEVAKRKRRKAITVKSEEEKEILRKLIGMANNLNQLAKAANSGTLLHTRIEETLIEIDKLIDKL